jgi:adenylosuccinate synthase
LRANLRNDAGLGRDHLPVKRWEDLPVNAQAYLNRLEELCEVPIAIVSTGPERDETILKQHPFK